jgi:hypothetical protein
MFFPLSKKILFDEITSSKNSSMISYTTVRTAKISVSLLLLFFLSNCGSSNEPDPLKNGGAGGDVTITSVSAETVYADDEITINGTGFSTDISKLQIQMGSGTDNFNEFDTKPAFTIVSASSTKIVVKADGDQEIYDLNYEFFYDAPYTIKVTSDGKAAVGSFAHVRRQVNFNLSAADCIDQVTGCFAYVQAGDSVYLNGMAGAYGTCSVSIDNHTIPGVKTIDANKLTFRIPRNILGGEDNCIEDIFPVKITNEDGKSQTKNVHIAKAPPMIITSAAFSKSTYGAGDDNATLKVKGYSLYSTAMVHMSKSGDPTFGTDANLGASPYSDEVTLQFTLSALDAGEYHIQIKKRDSDSYGFTLASFVYNK